MTHNSIPIPDHPITRQLTTPSPDLDQPPSLLLPLTVDVKPHLDDTCMLATTTTGVTVYMRQGDTPDTIAPWCLANLGDTVVRVFCDGYGIYTPLHILRQDWRPYLWTIRNLIVAPDNVPANLRRGAALQAA